MIYLFDHFTTRFADCQPSVAVVFLDHQQESLDELVGHAERVQGQFKNAFAISFGVSSHSDWNTFQIRVTGKTMRLFQTVDILDAMSLAMSCYETMKPNEKFKMQTRYFELEKERMCSGEVSRAVTTEAFDKMQIFRSDAQLIIEGFPTIASIISAPKEVMEENSPVDVSVINKISLFFGYETPTI